MKLTVNILLDGKPANLSAKLHATYQADANAQIVTSSPTEYSSGSIDWVTGTTKIFYDGAGTNTPSGVSFSDITPSDTQTSTGQDLVFNVNYVTSSSTLLYLGIGAAALAAYFMFFKKKSAAAIVGG